MILSTANKQPYIGRFAPSPTGPLHLGSLYTALASFLDARQQRGSWLLRIDDLDIPRNVNGATDSILRCLEHFQLHWDGEVYYQSRQLSDYQAILDQLLKQKQLFACRCSRKQLQGFSIYPGNCRDAAHPVDDQSALRLKTDDQQISFVDTLQGSMQHHLFSDDGDFVVRRRDQIIAYQFAVVIDDRQQGINHIVRGVDLLDSTPKQLYLQRLLGYPQPTYTHLPVVVDSNGHKLSKQTLATPVDNAHPAQTLWQLLVMMRQNPPTALNNAPVSQQLEWAIKHWQPQALYSIRSIPLQNAKSPNTQ